MKEVLLLCCVSIIILPKVIYSQQGTIEAEKVTADSLMGDGSRITGVPKQNLAVSISGDTLFITEGNWVLIPGLSASNSGNAFANAGADIVNACQTSFNLDANQLAQSQTGLWTIESGTGGNLINPTLPSALFVGQEGESYLLQWTVTEQGGSSSFDQLNVSIAVNTETSIADAGQDLFAIMTQTVILNGNAPGTGSMAEWEIIDGIGGILGNITDPIAEFNGEPGESYTLQWRHYNDCSTSTDEVILTFSPSASGTPSPSGRYFIPDPKFRQYLQIAYPSVMDGDSLVVAMGDQVDKVRITNLDVVNLDGLQYLTSFKVLEANSNRNLGAIPYFSDSLELFLCHNCQSLEVIPPFPLLLDTIEGESWKIASLPSLPPGLKFLYLNELQHVSSFPILPDGINFIRLLNFGNLTMVPKFPNSCEYVELQHIGSNCCYDLSLDTVCIPTNARQFRIEDVPLSEFPILPTIETNLEELSITDTKIASMPSLYDLTSLTSISLSQNSLFKLDSLPFILQQISVYDNPIICVENKPPLVADQLAEFDICPPQ